MVVPVVHQAEPLVEYPAVLEFFSLEGETCLYLQLFFE